MSDNQAIVTCFISFCVMVVGIYLCCWVLAPSPNERYEAYKSCIYNQETTTRLRCAEVFYGGGMK